MRYKIFFVIMMCSVQAYPSYAMEKGSENSGHGAPRGPRKKDLDEELSRLVQGFPQETLEAVRQEIAPVLAALDQREERMRDQTRTEQAQPPAIVTRFTPENQRLHSTGRSEAATPNLQTVAH